MKTKGYSKGGMKTKGYSKGGMKTKGYAKGGMADKDMSECTYKAKVPNMIKREKGSSNPIPMIKKETGRKNPIPMIKNTRGSKGSVGGTEMKEFKKMGTMKNSW